MSNIEYTVGGTAPVHICLDSVIYVDHITRHGSVKHTNPVDNNTHSCYTALAFS